jgi:hypothetical protein
MQAHRRQRIGMMQGHGFQAHDVALKRDGLQRGKGHGAVLMRVG